MTTYRCVVEYDGTDLHGFQYQPNLRTVAGEIETVLAKLFVEPVKITGAGRTDAGVHASGQVISFRCAREFPVDRLPIALNTYLPHDISVRDAALVEDAFNARFSAKARAYEYTLYRRSQRSALAARYGHHVHRAIDLERMRRAARDLEGEHDFIAFCGVLPESGGTVRTIHSATVHQDGARYRVRIVGDGFLHRMVRVSVGTLIEIATGRREPDDIPRILASKQRKAAGYTAPAAGLSLVGVVYEGFASELP